MLATGLSSLEQDLILISVNLHVSNLIEIYPLNTEELNNEQLSQVIPNAVTWIEENISQQPDFMTAALFLDLQGTHLAYYGQFRSRPVGKGRDYNAVNGNGRKNVREKRSLSFALSEIPSFTSHCFSGSVGESKTLTIEENNKALQGLEFTSSLQTVNYHRSLDGQRIIYVASWEHFDSLKNLVDLSGFEQQSVDREGYMDFDNHRYHTIYIKGRDN
jgi:hypothetical protein